MRIDWPEYSRVHANRTNLLIHLFAAPLFAGSIVFAIVSVVRGDWLAALVLLVLAFVAMALQGRAHRYEKEPPRPFTGPANFVRRWFAEQFPIFPAFVLSGRWSRQYRDEGADQSNES